MSDSKFCHKCQSEKSINDFCKRAASSDGLSSSCRDCQRAYDKKRANDPKRVAARAEYAKTSAGIEASKRAKKLYAERNRDLTNARCKAYRIENKKKSRCHDLVAYAVRIGSLVRKPCEICGEGRSVAHHDDYDKPLDVRWLCDSHHRYWHSENGEGANAS